MLAPSGQKIIEDRDGAEVPIKDCVDQVGAQKAGAAGHKETFVRHRVYVKILEGRARR